MNRLNVQIASISIFSVSFLNLNDFDNKKLKSNNKLQLDHEIKRILDTLKQKNILNNTVIVITANNSSNTETHEPIKTAH
ncbi:MAG: hypothetical protein ACTS85_04905 [Arsenophonus sp. NC-PG7-MAG3]